MCDIDLSVPEITSREYSQDYKFLLLRNYLVDLNDVLMRALGDKCDTKTIQELTGNIEKNNQDISRMIVKQNTRNNKRFKEIEDILSSLKSEN